MDLISVSVASCDIHSFTEVCVVSVEEDALVFWLPSLRDFDQRTCEVEASLPVDVIFVTSHEWNCMAIDRVEFGLEWQKGVVVFVIQVCLPRLIIPGDFVIVFSNVKIYSSEDIGRFVAVESDSANLNGSVASKTIIHSGVMNTFWLIEMFIVKGSPTTCNCRKRTVDVIEDRSVWILISYAFYNSIED